MQQFSSTRIRRGRPPGHLSNEQACFVSPNIWRPRSVDSQVLRKTDNGWGQHQQSLASFSHLSHNLLLQLSLNQLLCNKNLTTNIHKSAKVPYRGFLATTGQWPGLSPYYRRQIPFIWSSTWNTNVGIRWSNKKIQHTVFVNWNLYIHSWDILL